MSPPPLLLHVFATFATGGPQVRFCAVANRFGRRWRHAIVAMNGDLSCRERLEPGLDVSFPETGVRKGDLAGNLRRFRAALRRLRPAALVTSNFGSIEWALARRLLPGGPRHVHTEDGFGPEERDRQLPRRVWLRRLALPGATVVLPSRTLLRIATEQWRLNAGRLRYVPNGVDLRRFRPADPAADPGTDPAAGGPVVGTVATLRAEKNIGRLLRAFAAAAAGTPARLVIVGDGPVRPALEAEAAALGLAGRVSFAGPLPRPEAAYRGFDVFALSSDTEQMPLSLLEAMGSGLPVAATDVGDVRDMLAEPNRRFVVPPDDAALATALAALLRDPPLRRALGGANRARVQDVYDEETMFQAYAALFDGAPA